jgi:hypothetical protein
LSSGVGRAARQALGDLGRGVSAWTWLVCGGVVGGLAAFTQAQYWTAEAVVIFPSVNTPIYRKVQQELSQSSATPGLEALTFAPDDSSQRIVRMASLVLESRTASRAVAEKVDLDARLPFPWNFRHASQLLPPFKLRVKRNDLAGLVVGVSAPDSALALDLCRAYLDYYREFTQNAALTNTKRSRLYLEDELMRSQRDILAAEEKLFGLKTRKLDPAGDLEVGTSSEMMRQLWRRRVQELALQQTAADDLQRLRGEPPSTAPGGGSEQVRVPSAGVRSASPRELKERIRWERIYADATQLHRELLTQYTRLREIETLEQPGFELVDAPAVQPRRWWHAVPWLLSGWLAAAVLCWLRRFMIRLR